ncbi:MAG: hypothetical protein WBB07_26710 [Mycobacterium sp.]
MFADDFVEDDLDDAHADNNVNDWVDANGVLDAIEDGEDPFADPITNPAEDLFFPEPDLLGCTPGEIVAQFRSEVSAEAVAAVLTDPRVVADCTSYDDDLIDSDLRYSVRRATDTAKARLTVMRVLSDPEQLYRFHHFEPQETPTGSIRIELLTQKALGIEQDVIPVTNEDVGHYVDALSCCRRLRRFLAHSA